MAKKGENPNREFIERWRRAGPELERIRKEELRSYVHQDNVSNIDAVLQLGVDMALPRKTSGLVEFQRILGKLRRQ